MSSTACGGGQWRRRRRRRRLLSLTNTIGFFFFSAAIPQHWQKSSLPPFSTHVFCISAVRNAISTALGSTLIVGPKGFRQLPLEQQQPPAKRALLQKARARSLANRPTARLGALCWEEITADGDWAGRGPVREGSDRFYAKCHKWRCKKAITMYTWFLVYRFVWKLG